MSPTKQGENPWQPIDKVNFSSLSQSEVIDQINDAVDRFLAQGNDCVEGAVTAGAVPQLVELLKLKQEATELHIAALRALLCIVHSKEARHGQAIANAGAIPHLLDLLLSPDEFLVNLTLNLLHGMTAQLGVRRMFPLGNSLVLLVKLAEANINLAELSLSVANQLLKERSPSDEEFMVCVSTLSRLQLDGTDVYTVNAVRECLVLLSNFARKHLAHYLSTSGLVELFVNVLRRLRDSTERVVITGMGRSLTRLFSIERNLVQAALEAGLLEEAYILAMGAAEEENEVVNGEVSWIIAATMIHCDADTLARILHARLPPSSMKYYRASDNVEYRMTVSLLNRILLTNVHVEAFLRDHLLPVIVNLERNKNWMVLGSLLNCLKASLKAVKRRQSLDQINLLMFKSGVVNVMTQLHESSNPCARRLAGDILDIIK